MPTWARGVGRWVGHVMGAGLAEGQIFLTRRRKGVCEAEGPGGLGGEVVLGTGVVFVLPQAIVKTSIPRHHLLAGGLGA